MTGRRFPSLAAAALLAAVGPAVATDGAADHPAAKARQALRDCLEGLPAERLSDEAAIGRCLDQGQRAAESERKREGQIEFMRRLDEMDRLIDRTTRGSRR